MNPDDRAVVIGIRRYADAAHPTKWISTLNGPDNDAAAIADWLRKPGGGGLPHDNVRVVRSADFTDPFPPQGVGPHQQAIMDALDELATLPTTAFDGQYAGRRLYVYMSGHGLAKRPDQAALVTAEATHDTPLNVEVTSWMEWLYMGTRFRELVLWVDCCATRAPRWFLQPCKLEQSFSMNDKRGRFFAYAAGFGKQAVEAEMEDGKWHGAFTYALLQGLEGAAAGEVTSDHLRAYLINNMKSFMRDDQHIPAVSDEPTFGPTDPMTFVTVPERPEFPVTLQFPPAGAGKRATVSVNASSPLVADTVLGAGAVWSLTLTAGSYAAFVPDLDLHGPFTVTGEGSGAVVAIS